MNREVFPRECNGEPLGQHFAAFKGKESKCPHDALVTIDPSNPQGFWSSKMANVLYAITIPELYTLKSVNEITTEGKSSEREAGDIGIDFLGFLAKNRLMR